METTGNGADDRPAARACDLLASLSGLVHAAGLPPDRAARWAATHAGEDDPAATAVLWADLADWCRDAAEHLAALADATLDPTPPPTVPEEHR